MTRERRMFTSF
jgi:hypothetical protein